MEEVPDLVSSLNPQVLIKGLIILSQKIAANKHGMLHHRRNTLITLRRIHLLQMLFDELNLSHTPLPPSALFGLRELCSTFRKVTMLLDDCETRSCIWQIMCHEAIAYQFREILQDMAKALDILPMQLFDIPEDVREHVDLASAQMKQARVFLEVKDDRIRSALLSAIQDMEKHADCDVGKMRFIVQAMELNHLSACNKEVKLLEGEIWNHVQSGGSSLSNISTISKLITFLRYAMCMLYNQGPPSTDLNYTAVLNPMLTSTNDQFVRYVQCPTLVKHHQCSMTLYM